MNTKKLMHGLLFVASLGFLLAAPPRLWAASGTWYGTLDNVWSTTNNWNSTNTVPGTGNTATFNNAGNGQTTLDLGAGVTLKSILFDTVGAAAYTVGSGAVGSQILTLNDGGGITLNSTVASDQLVNASLTLGTATASAYTNTQNAVANTLTFAGGVQGGSGGVGGAKTLTIMGAGTTTISGLIANGGASSVSLSKAGTGTLIVTGPNTYSGNTTAGGGVLRADYGVGLPSATGVLYLNGGGVLETAGTIARTLGTAAGNVSFSGSGGFAARGGPLGVTFNAGATLNIAGTGSFVPAYYSLVLGSPSADNVVTLNNSLDSNANGWWPGFKIVHNTSLANTLVDKVLVTGSLNWTGGNNNNTYWQKYGNGRLEIAGAPGTQSANSGVVVAGGILALTGPAALAGYKGVWLAGGDFEITGSSTNNTAKSITVLGLSSGNDLLNTQAATYGGPGTVTLVPGSGYSAKLTAASVSRSAGGTVLFRGTGLGIATNPSPDVANLLVADQTGLSLTGDATNTNTLRKIVPYAIGDNSATGNGTDFVTYYGTNGIRLLTAGEYTNAITDGQSALDNVSLTGVQTLSVPTTVNALRLGSGGGVAGSGPLTLNSGAILALSGNVGLSVGTLAFGAKEAVVTTLGDLSISGALTGSSGLTKSGAGKLTLSGSNAITGTNTVNAGALVAGTANVLAAGTLRLQPGAMADMAGFEQTLATLAGATTGIFTNSGTATNLTINAAADATLGPTLFGNINLVKTGAATFAVTPGQLANSGGITVKAGTLQVGFVTNNGTTGKAITLDGGSLFYYSLVQNNNSGVEHTFGDNITVNAGGGLIKLDTVTGFNPINGGRLTGSVTLNGSLTLSNSPAANGVSQQWALNNLQVNGTQALYNNSPAAAQYTAILPSAIVGGGTASLSLATDTGAGFLIPTPTSTSIDLVNLVANANLNLYFYSSNSLPAYDPLQRLLINGGRLTVGDNRTLTLHRWGRYTQNDATFGTNTTLSLYGDNWDSGWTVTNDLTVGGVSNPAVIAYRPFRGGLTVTSGSLIITNGGRLQFNGARADGSETMSANMKWFNGATIQGNNNNVVGGLVRSSGTLTLGDGTPSTIAIRGNNGANAQFFQLGYAASLVDSGNVVLRYESQGTAGQYFNVAWASGGSVSAPTVTSLRGGSAGTEFAPGASQLALVGPASGPVFVATNACRLITAGTGVFYSASAASRGALGPLVVTNTGSLLLTNGAVALASNVTIYGGTIGGGGTVAATNTLMLTNGATYQVWLYGAASNQCGMLAASNTVVFSSDSVLAAVPTNGFSPTPNQYWLVAYAPAISGQPSAPAGYSVEVQGNYLKLTKLSTAGFSPAIANVNPTNVQQNSAYLNGNLMSTGAAPVTVSVFWGTADGGSNLAGSTWANTNTFPSIQPQGYLSTNVTLSPNTYYYYRYYAINSYGDFMADPVQSLITGDIDIQKLADAGETGPVTGLFSVARAAALTNEDLTVNYAISGTASNGGDYASLSGTVLIPRGATNANLAVVPLADPFLEGTETVTLTLLPGNYVIGTVPTATVAIADYAARNLTWTDSGGSHKWNGIDTNWTDGTAQPFTDGDNVTFDDSAANRTIMIVSTVQPATVTFLNTSAATYRLTNGVLAGAATLTVAGGGTLKLGLDALQTTAPVAPLLTHSGGTLISNNSLIKYSCGSASPTNALGMGPVTLNGGRLNLNFSGVLNGGSMWFANVLDVGALGGALDLSPDGGGNDRRPYWYFPGGVTLGGPLAVIGDGQNYGLVNTPTISGAVTLSGDQTITNGTINTPVRINLVALSGASRTLTLAGGSFGLVAGGTALNVSNINCLASLGIMDSIGVNDVDYLSQIRTNGGKVTMAGGKTLALGRGVWTPSDFTFDTNVTISLSLGGQGGTAKFMGDMTIGTNAGQAAQLYWALGQNEVLATASGKTLTIGAGGLLNIWSGNMPALMDGNLRFTDGSRFNLTWTPNSTFGRTSGTFYLGDGNAATQETVRITGSMNADNSLNIFNVNYPVGNISDDGNVVLRYESNAGSAGTSFNMAWAFGTFRGGSAGTIFAPAPGTLGFLAIGPASGPVLTISNTVTVATAGTVGFYNSSGSSIASQGPLVVTNGGSLAFSTNGIVLAGNTTFYAGSTQAVVVVGTASNAIGYLKVVGNLIYNNGTKLVGSNPSRCKPVRGYWYVAEATSIIGTPSFSGFSAVEIEPGSPQRLKVFPDVIGSVFTFR